MPIAAPSNLENRHLAVSNLSRNDSLKSERSDKRVSFNNDVGVKHIPRGSNKPPAPLPPPQKPKSDEWSGCKPVKLQHNNLSEAELQKEADSLIDLVDSINCKASPLPSRKNKDYSSRSLDRSHKRNNIDANQPRGSLDYVRVTNPLIRHLKADLSRSDKKGSSYYSDSDSERKRRAQYKSVPNLVVEDYNNRSNESRNLNGNEKHVNYSSVDNLLDRNNVDYRNNNLTPSRTGHASAEDLLDYPRPRKNFGQYKSLGNLNSRAQDSDSSETSYRKKPKVDEIIKRLNKQNTQTYVNGYLSSERETSPSRKVSSSSKNSNNSNEFSPKITNIQYKDNNFLANNKQQSEDMYAQVNKNGLRQRLSLDSDYSAKIIIGEEKPRHSYDDDDTYETYQVTNNTLHGTKYKDYGVNLSSHSNKYRDDDNVNMNMSSVAVQTDNVRKALNKDRRTPKAMAPQPPVDAYPAQSYRSGKNLTTDLPSANLVRQVNHGFGRYDRSPSPPARKTYNRTAMPHVVPLLSDTSDSDTEYRRRADPLAKIRTQVLSNERLHESHVTEEYDERNLNTLNRNKHDLNFNPRGMKPVTIEEVDKMSLELDHSNRRNYSESTTNTEHKSFSHKSNQRSNVREISNERAIDVERSRPLRPSREKSFNARDVSIPREEETVVPSKTSSVEKEKETEKKTGTFRFRGKEKKNKDTLKDKKKKRIKIKFFYDPRPQDKNTEDPLKSYTEYKGNDSPTKIDGKVPVGLKDDHKISRADRSPSVEKPKARDDRGRDYVRNRSRENSRDRLRNHSRDSSRERTLSRPGNVKMPVRTPRNHSSSYEDSNDDRRRVRSTDRYERRNEYTSNRNETRNVKRLSYDLDHKVHIDKHPDDRDNIGRNVYDHSRNDINSRHEPPPRQNQPVQRRSTFLERREAYERRDSSNNEGSGPQRQEMPSRTNAPKTESRYARYHTDSQEEHSRNEEEPARAGRPMGARVTAGTDDRGPGTLRRPSRRPDDSPPPPRRTSRQPEDSPPPIRRSQKPVFRPENQRSPERQRAPSNRSVTIKSKKKKKSWPWNFLGLRGTRRKKSKASPTRTAGSDISSVSQRRAQSNSRPTSRASSHRSNQRPGRPSVRASKIRKDLGDRSRQRFSRVGEQREARHWESSTLQRPPGAAASRTLEARGPGYPRRRFSEESSASSGGEQRGMDRRQGGYAQKYIPDSQYDQDQKSGPGDYRSLPVRTHRAGNTRLRAANAGIGSAGSSLQSSESENDSHHGSRASHVSTGSNRSVYLHATAVADIPVTDGDGRPGVKRQARKVTRSFSMAAPWRPRRASRDASHPPDYEAEGGRAAAKPPRPPRRPSDTGGPGGSGGSGGAVGRAHTLTQKDNKLSGWLRRRKSKEGKGI